MKFNDTLCAQNVAFLNVKAGALEVNFISTDRADIPKRLKFLEHSDVY
jgi:hypothetical protein